MCVDHREYIHNKFNFQIIFTTLSYRKDIKRQKLATKRSGEEKEYLLDSFNNQLAMCELIFYNLGTYNHSYRHKPKTIHPDEHYLYKPHTICL